MRIPTLALEIEQRSIAIPWSGCWIWEGPYRDGRGYGVMTYEGRSIGAHRASFLAFNGVIPHGQYVCHRCDVPECVNPAHLFTGTPFDNFNDMRRKGRRVQSTIYGERNGSAKLTAEKVREIRDLAGVKTQRAIAAMYGVDHSVISHIQRGLLWKAT